MSTLLVRCVAAISFLVSSTYTFFPPYIVYVTPINLLCNFLVSFLIFFSNPSVVVQLLSHVPSLPPHGLQHARLLCPSLSLEFAQVHVH